MTNTECADWVPLSEARLEEYYKQGYLHMKGVFSPAEVECALAIIDEVLADGAPNIARHSSFTDRTHTTRVRDAVSRHPDLDYFLDHPNMIGPLVSLLGLSVQILGTEIFRRSVLDEAMDDWHTDGGEYLQRVRLAPGSRDLQLKAQVFVTDTTEAESGNFMLIPGSHHKLPGETIPTCYIEELNGPWRAGVVPAGAVMIRAEPGDVLFFPYSLWHAVARNRRQVRKTFIFRYGHLWHRPHDYLAQPRHILDRMSPRLRRMFGDLGEHPHPTEFYKPSDQDKVMAHGRVAEATEPDLQASR